VDETRAFAEMPVFPEAGAAELCRLVLMRILPGVAECDADAFGRGVAELQRRVGDFFAPYQGGRYTSPAVAAAIADIEALGVPGVGQSSWGPTGFAVLGSEAEARDLVAALAPRHGERLRLVVARGRNRGAEVRLDRAATLPKDPVRTP
jgi:predicted sugar kinase